MTNERSQRKYVDSYQAVLHKWAKRELGRGHYGPFTIVSVRLDYEPGYRYSEYTEGDAQLNVVVTFRHSTECCNQITWMSTSEDMNTITMLNELLAIADEVTSPR